MYVSTKTIVTSVVAVIILLAGWAGFAQVQEKPKEKAVPTKKPSEVKDAPKAVVKEAPKEAAKEAKVEDEETIRRSAEAFTAAYNTHDAKKVSELFALKAEFTDEEGNLIKGRAAIEQDFAGMFEKFPDCKIEVEVSSIRVLTPHIAIEEGVVRGQPLPDEPGNVSSYVAVHVKVDGNWVIASVSDFEADAEELSANDHLQQLAWMVGEWLDESPVSTVKTSCRWDESGNYLLNDFVVHFAGRGTVTGSMRIGWDPLSRQLKSWTFDADSGYSEGLWTRIDDEWIVKAHGVNAAGEVTSSANVFRFIDSDTMTWRSHDRVVGGKAVDDIPENVIKRHAPPPEG